ncbi:MAG: B12-binding domain-containing radical SAM protein, partial [Myxococcales bacterium]
LDNLHRRGHRGAVDVVDDNFIGNQAEVARLLPAVRAWQEEHSWPFELATEVSLNIADRPRLLQLMREAGFCAVFVGIETSEEGALLLSQKRQNTRRDVVDSVHKLYAHGMLVMAGYIVGFDGERPGLADRVIQLIEATAIPVNMVGLLFALPTTQLTRRLAREGRLPPDFDVVRPETGGDQCSAGLNFETSRPKSEVLRDYIRILETIYRPEAYFDRVLRMALALDNGGRKLSLGGRGQLKELTIFFRMVWGVGLRRSWGWRWWKLLVQVLARNPSSIRYALWMATLYVHFSGFAVSLVEGLDRRVAEEEIRERAAATGSRASL